MGLVFSFKELQQKIVHCRTCPRLAEFRQNIAPIAMYRDEPHWRKAVPGFGDPKAKLLILGLAPAAVGGNRTGRIFTGDLTAKFLIPALHKAGYANQPTSEAIGDGLQVKDCYLTAAVKCTPPQHKPLKSEFDNCSCYLDNEIFLLKELSAILALGKSAFDAYLDFLKRQSGLKPPFPKFSHGVKQVFSGWPTLYASYHPTPRNTNTGLLTETMFLAVLRQIKKESA